MVYVVEAGNICKVTLGRCDDLASCQQKCIGSQANGKGNCVSGGSVSICECSYDC